MVYQSHPLAVLAKKHLRRVLEFKRRSDRFTSGDGLASYRNFGSAVRKVRIAGRAHEVGYLLSDAAGRCRPCPGAVLPRPRLGGHRRVLLPGPDKARSPSSSAPSSTANGNGASVRPGASQATSAALPSLLPQNEHQERWAFRISEATSGTGTGMGPRKRLRFRDYRRMQGLSELRRLAGPPPARGDRVAMATAQPGGAGTSRPGMPAQGRDVHRDRHGGSVRQAGGRASIAMKDLLSSQCIAGFGPIFSDQG